MGGNVYASEHGQGPFKDVRSEGVVFTWLVQIGRIHSHHLYTPKHDPSWDGLKEVHRKEMPRKKNDFSTKKQYFQLQTHCTLSSSLFFSCLFQCLFI